MDPSESAKLAKLVDASGFLFQVAVEEHVRAKEDTHQWRVIAREYPWSSADGARGGFIDFVADRNGLRCVFECKRTQGGNWVFLVPKHAKPTVELRTLWSFKVDDDTNDHGWTDLHFDPPTFCSEFCIVRGGSDDDKPMLERIVGDLVRASEALAREELRMYKRHVGLSAYIPVVVTNAKLYVCRVDPEEVELKSGEVPKSASFEEINQIRFRKTTASDVSHTPETYQTMSEGLIKKERGALVVNVEHLSQWLSDVSERLPGLSIPSRPWRHLEK